MVATANEHRIAYAERKLKRFGQDVAAWRADHARAAHVWAIEDFLLDACRLGEDLVRATFECVTLDTLAQWVPEIAEVQSQNSNDHLASLRDWVEISDTLLSQCASISEEGFAVDGVTRLRLWARVVRNAIDKYDVAREFFELRKAWKVKTRHLSSTTAITSDASYLRIIAMGKPAVPHILNDLKMQPAHWYKALAAITGEDPVTDVMRGKMQMMADAWLAWGRERGLC